MAAPALALAAVAVLLLLALALAPAALDGVAPLVVRGDRGILVVTLVDAASRVVVRLGAILHFLLGVDLGGLGLFR